MEKISVAGIFTDLHIKDENCENILDLVIQSCDIAKIKGIKRLICLGDVFQSRKSQSLKVLSTFRQILDVISDYDLELHIISGNHDKTTYDSQNSFLDAFKYHPVLKLYELTGGLPIKEHNLHLSFIPFFSNERWLEIFNDLKAYIGEFKKDKKYILFSHLAVNGSVNNDGTKVESSISPKLFKNFYKVFLGHYHNQHQIGKNIFHLPSIQQNNFGEDSEKGLTILYADGSHELVKLQFKTYVKVKIDLNELSKNEISDLSIKYAKETQDKFIRFELIGTEEKIKSIDKEKIQLLGIDVKTKNKDIEVIEDFDEVTVEQYSLDSIVEEFKEFCEDNNYKFEEGFKYLKNLI